MTAKKTPPPPQALYMDNVPGGDPEIQLLYARLGTYKMDGEKAMSPHDLRNGYTPKTIIRMMTRQLLVMLKAKESALEEDDEWRDHLGTWRPPYLLRDEIAHLERQLETMKNPAQNDPRHPLMDESKATTGGGVTDPEPEKENAKAIRILELCSEMRNARQTIESQIRDLRKAAKVKVNTLKNAEAVLLDQNEDGQLQLFDLDPEVSKEIQGIIDNPDI
mgnify:FL=1